MLAMKSRFVDRLLSRNALQIQVHAKPVLHNPASSKRLFESSDQLFSWLRQGELCSEEQIWRLASDFKRNLSAEIELEVSEEAAAKQSPPLKPEPGEVVYSEEFTAKLAAWEAAQKKAFSR